MISSTGFKRHIFMASAWALVMLSMGCSLKVQKKALHQTDDLRALPRRGC